MRANWSAGRLAHPALARVIAALVTSLVLAGVAAPALAFELPPSQPGVRVYDFAHIWRDDTKVAAQALADRVEQKTGAQIAIVSVPTGESYVDTGMAAFDAETILDTWGVGRAGVNDGLVVLFDMDTTNRHGQIYLATGKGYLESYLSDSEAQSIVNDDMLPKAKDGDLDAALTNGLAHIERVTQPGGNPERAFLATVRQAGAAIALLAGLLVLGLFLRTWWQRGRDARTPLIDDSVLLPAPPPGLTPALATVLRHDGVTKEAFTSALVDLGHRGLVTFQAEDGILDKLQHKVDLVVPDRPLDDAASEVARERPLGVAEHSLYDQISTKATEIDDQGRAVLTASRLRTGIGHELFDDFKKHIGVSAGSSGWFVDDPNKLVTRWQAIGIVVSVISVALFFAFCLADSSTDALMWPGTEPLAAAFGIDFLFGVFITILSGRLAARTEAGAQVLAMAMAYRNTLEYELKQAPTVDAAVDASKAKLPWIKTPDILTVWAVALGLNHEIDALVQRTFATQGTSGSAIWAPLWFSGGSGGSSWGSIGGAGGIAAAVGSISTSSTSSSGGGFGGGGGGGGGGAGGGF